MAHAKGIVVPLFWETRNTAELTIGMKILFDWSRFYVHRLDGPHPKSINHLGVKKHNARQLSIQ
jgi:hypothetical protein